MESINTDVLVVGAGLAGFTAAARAAEQNAKVLLIDKSAGELGDGNILMGSGSLRAGEDMELRAGAVILSTGGFSANRELLKKHNGPFADRCKLRGSKQDTGDGLRMALVAGAKTVNLKYFYGHLISRKALVDENAAPPKL
jgi:tricarballylate dehydrogenase